MNSQPVSYDMQVSAQISQYASGDEIHNLPAIFHYWYAKHLMKAAEEVAGATMPSLFYAKWIIEAVKRTGRRRVVSLGAGNAAVEIEVQREIQKLGCSDIIIECLELSPVLIAEGKAAIASSGFADNVSMTQIDLNQKPNFGKAAAVMANQSLHHMVTLEEIFGAASAALTGGGLFLTCDMIGRNGHMRWPEALHVIRYLWDALPDRLKYHHQLRRFHRHFENWDCSIEGFEGIRAQDILRLMTQTFHFERFFCFGGISDIIVDRGYGPNFDPEIQDDQAVIDAIMQLEAELSSKGMITPTQMWAVASPDKSTYEIRCNRQPERCVRDPLAKDPHIPESILKSFPLIPIQSTQEVVLDFGVRVEVSDIPFDSFLWGWADVEDNLVWGLGEESALRVSIPAQESGILSIEVFGYKPASVENQILEFYLDEAFVGRATLAPDILANLQFDLSAITTPFDNRNAKLRIRPSAYRRPDIEGGEDKRPLAFVLKSISVNSAAR